MPAFALTRDDVRHPALGALIDDVIRPAGGAGIQGADDAVILILLCQFLGYTAPESRRYLRGLPHVLVEGVPGVAKTALAQRIAAALAGPALTAVREYTRRRPCVRVQFHPNTTPEDLLGSDYPTSDRKDMVFQDGPLLGAELLHADELNRTPPKTQAALLEAMQEFQVTITTQDPKWRDNPTRRLSPFFSVLATQNPLEQEGTFPLPEAQLDRFVVKLNMNYTLKLPALVRFGEPAFDWRTLENLRQPIKNGLDKVGFTNLAQAWDAKPAAADVAETERVLRTARHDQLDKLREEAAAVRVGDDEARLIAALVYATWNPDTHDEVFGGPVPRELEPLFRSSNKRLREVNDQFQSGASPRAAFALRNLAAAIGWAKGKKEVGPAEVRAAAPFVLRHRVALKYTAALEGKTADRLLRELIDIVLGPA